MENEISLGQQLAAAFRPFIDPKETYRDEIVSNMEKSIDQVIKKSKQQLKDRVKQLLSSLDYEALSDHQAKIVLLLEKEIQ